MSKNAGDVLKDSQLYLNQESLVKKMRTHFVGLRTEFMAQRFYLVLAGGMQAKRISFYEFAETLEETLLSQERREQMRFAFELLDSDNNGLLSGPDLLVVQENIEPTSEYAEELQRVIEFFVRKHVLVKDPRFIGLSDNIDLNRYLALINHSCIIDEFKTRILTKPGKANGVSVLAKRS